MESRRLQRVNLAIDFIEGHLHERLSLDGAAAAAHYSKYHLHRLFTEAAAGALGFSWETGRIEFLGVHPRYRGQDIIRLFLGKLEKEYLPGREISVTTYRENDRADTGWRAELKRLGFAEREELIEFGYPTQRFVLRAEETGVGGRENE